MTTDRNASSEHKGKVEKWVTIQVPEGTYIITPADLKNQRTYWAQVLAAVLVNGKEKAMEILASNYVIGSTFTTAVQEAGEFGQGGQSL